jgi:hypothetical protein
MVATLEESMMDDEALNKIIQDKIATGEADSGWVVALLLLRVTPVLKEIADNFKIIDSALAPDLKGYSISEKLADVANALKGIKDKLS